LPYLLKPYYFQYFILSDDGVFPALSDPEATEVRSMALLQSTDQHAVKQKKKNVVSCTDFFVLAFQWLT
jgi:hypothetical protein